MTYNIGMVSLGCAKNQTDAEIMLGILADEGHNIVSNPKDADIIIVNTCGFIEPAKQESIDNILEMAEYKKGRCKLLIATGCLAERYHDDIALDLPEVDAIVGTGDFHKISEVIKDAASGDKPILFGNKNYTPEEGLPRLLSTPPYTAYLKISDGCDNSCTYCAIPMIRGKYRSRKIEDIVAEAKDLAKKGVKELILIAQDTSRYGKDIYDGFALDKLLEELVKVDGIEWIRTHYFYAEAVTENLVKVMAKYDKICNYIDIPIQHINNRILRRMGRKTNRDEIISKIEMIRKYMPESIIRTSIIVGFPGETDEEFEELYDFVSDIKFDRMGVFSYSQEEDTPAADFPDQIDEEIKEYRLDRLMTLQQGISLLNNQKRIGKSLDVLIEGYDIDNFMYYGRSKGDSIDIDSTIYVASEDELNIGEIVKVEILDAGEYDLTGKTI